MKIYAPLLLSATVLTACHSDAAAPKPGAPAAAEPAGKVKLSTTLKTVEIVDQVFGLVAFRMQIPDDWSFEGVVLRDPSCGLLPSIAFRASSADGLAGYQALPQFGWHSSDDPITLAAFRNAHCKLMEPLSPAEFLTWVLPSIRPNPTAGPIEPTVDAAQLQANITQYNQRSQQAHLPSSSSGGGVHSRIEYVYRGQPMEENLRVVVTNFKNQVGAYGAPHWAWSSTADVSGVRAPKGQFDEVAKVIFPLAAKAGYTAEWQQRVAAKMADDNNRVMALIKQQGDQAMAQLKRQGEQSAAVLKRNHEAYLQQSKEHFEHSQAIEREREDAVHRSAAAYTLYAGDEQLVRNPGTGQVTRVTSQHGSNGFQNEAGEITLSNDPNFNPNFLLRGTWTQLENVNPLKP